MYRYGNGRHQWDVPEKDLVPWAKVSKSTLQRWSSGRRRLRELAIKLPRGHLLTCSIPDKAIDLVAIPPAFCAHSEGENLLHDSLQHLAQLALLYHLLSPFRLRLRTEAQDLGPLNARTLPQ